MHADAASRTTLRAPLLYDINAGADDIGADVLNVGASHLHSADVSPLEDNVLPASIPGKHRVAGLPRKRPRDTVLDAVSQTASTAAVVPPFCVPPAKAAPRVSHEYPDPVLAPVAADYQLQNGPGAVKAAKPFRAPAGAVAPLSFGVAAATNPLTTPSAVLWGRKVPTSPALATPPDTRLQELGGAAGGYAPAQVDIAEAGESAPQKQASVVCSASAPVVAVSSFRAPGIVALTPVATAAAASSALKRGRALFSDGDGDGYAYAEGLSTDEPAARPSVQDMLDEPAGSAAELPSIKGPTVVRARPKLSKRVVQVGHTGGATA